MQSTWLGYTSAGYNQHNNNIKTNETKAHPRYDYKLKYI